MTPAPKSTRLTMAVRHTAETGGNPVAGSRRHFQIKEAHTMKTLTAKERRELDRLQAEYNRVHDRLGYMNSPASIAAANRTLDRLVERMDAILNTAAKSR